MSSIPVISVVIPTYNRANDLKRALKSVQVQTFTNWEVLIVDNHSVDNTDQVVSDFNDSRIKLFKIHNNGVIAASRNVGIREASGAYIAFLLVEARKIKAELRRAECGS
jgi:glycosyltransferase involved in cell wall biosynthesis